MKRLILHPFFEDSELAFYEGDLCVFNDSWNRFFYCF